MVSEGIEMMQRRQFLQMAGGGAASALALTGANTRAVNVVVILADDLGYGDLSCYGSPFATPHLDRLASEGVRYTQGYVASPICSPSRVGIMTGQCPSRHRIFSYVESRAKNHQIGMRDWLDPKVPNIARTFQQAGYATGHFGKWHMGGGRDVGDAPLITEYGFDESLTSFEGLGDRVLPPGKLSEQSEKLGRGKISHAPKHKLTEIFVDRAVDFISRHRDRPFYVNLWPDDVHDPFQPDPELLKKYADKTPNKYQAQFWAVLEEFDRQMGRFADKLDGMGLAENTVIVFLGDNGPTAWPFYYKEHLDPPGLTGGFRGRKWSLYEGGIRESFFVRWKGRTPANHVDERTVISSLDLFPSLCRVAGVKTPPVAFDGEDVSASFFGKDIRREKDLFWEYGRDASFLRPGLTNDQSPNLAMRSGDWKLLMNADGTDQELYDLKKNPREDHNVAAENRAVTKRLRERLMNWRRGLP